MPTLQEMDITIAKQKAALKILAENHRRAVERGDTFGSLGIRQQMAKQSALISSMEMERRMATPVDQRSDGSIYSRGASFWGSNG
jgi:hypothetical protein